jgi:glycosyltransferase 2 family protein
VNSRVLRLVVPFGISALLLYLVFRGVQSETSQLTGGELSEQLLATLAAANWGLLPFAVVLYFIGIWIRSIRWGLLLPEHSVKTSSLFRALVVGFTVNDLLPFRVGEVARAYLLAQWCRIPYGATVASLLVERVLDGFSLAILLLLALTLPLPQPPPSYLLIVGVIAAGVSLGAAAVLGLASWRASAVSAVARLLARRLPLRFGVRIEQVASNFASSLSLVRSPGRLVRLLGLSLLAWCLEMGLFFILLLSFGLPGGYPLALLVGSAANFATLVPSSPGYAGTFDSAVIKLLGDAASIGIVQAITYDFAVHATLILPVVVVGMLVLWQSHMSFRQITHAPERSTAVLAGSGRRAA